jgi:hypothetical protein
MCENAFTEVYLSTAGIDTTGVAGLFLEDLRMHVQDLFANEFR